MNTPDRTLEVAEAIKYVSGRLVIDGLVKSRSRYARSDFLKSSRPSSRTTWPRHLADADALVFSSPRGGPLNYQNFMLRIWKPAVTTAGLEGVTAHDLRHSAATYLDAVGAPEQLMRRRLGHGSSDITRRVYVHVLDETDQRITRALSDLVWPSTSPATEVEHPSL